eukprot:COSAG06_NODE_522_length_14708_cov_276.456773_4_plen_420_part_00
MQSSAAAEEGAPPAAAAASVVEHVPDAASVVEHALAADEPEPAESSTPTPVVPTAEEAAPPETAAAAAEARRWREAGLTGTLQKHSPADGSWRACTCELTREALRLDGEQVGQNVASLALEDIGIVRAVRDEAEAHGRPMARTFLIKMAESEGGATHILSADSPEERCSWVQLLAAARAPQLFKGCAVGPSAQFLFDFAAGLDVVAAKETMRALTVADVQQMIKHGPNRNGKKSELGEGSWSVQLLLPHGRLTWANMPKQEHAPTAEQLHREWLPQYIETTRMVWENVLGACDPLRASAPAAPVAPQQQNFDCLPLSGTLQIQSCSQLARQAKAHGRMRTLRTMAPRLASKILEWAAPFNESSRRIRAPLWIRISERSTSSFRKSSGRNSRTRWVRSGCTARRTSSVQVQSSHGWTSLA